LLRTIAIKIVCVSVAGVEHLDSRPQRRSLLRLWRVRVRDG